MSYDVKVVGGRKELVGGRKLMSKRGAAAEELRVRGFRMRSKIQRWEANGNGED